MAIGKKINSELFSGIIITCGSVFKTNFGKCELSEPLERCAFQDCSQSIKGVTSSSHLIACPERTIDIEIKLSNDNEISTCRWKNEMASYVVQISLNSAKGRFFCFLYFDENNSSDGTVSDIMRLYPFYSLQNVVLRV